MNYVTLFFDVIVLIGGMFFILAIALCIGMIWWTWTCLTGNYADKLLDLHLAHIGAQTGMKFCILGKNGWHILLHWPMSNLGRSVSAHVVGNSHGMWRTSRLTEGLNVYLESSFAPASPSSKQLGSKITFPFRYQKCWKLGGHSWRSTVVNLNWTTSFTSAGFGCKVNFVYIFYYWFTYHLFVTPVPNGPAIVFGVQARLDSTFSMFLRKVTVANFFLIGRWVETWVYGSRLACRKAAFFEVRTNTILEPICLLFCLLEKVFPNQNKGHFASKDKKRVATRLRGDFRKPGFPVPIAAHSFNTCGMCPPTRGENLSPAQLQSRPQTRGFKNQGGGERPLCRNGDDSWPTREPRISRGCTKPRWCFSSLCLCEGTGDLKGFLAQLSTPVQEYGYTSRSNRRPGCRPKLLTPCQWKSLLVTKVRDSILQVRCLHCKCVCPTLGGENNCTATTTNIFFSDAHPRNLRH